MQARPSRTALVNFFNDTLDLNITKVDDLGTGAAYCQLLDTIYGDVPVHRVKFDSRSLLDMQQNYKILQQVFIRHNIKHEFDPLRLMKCRLQDNLDFSQWLYQFWYQSQHLADYDPVARRSSSGGGGHVQPARQRTPAAPPTTQNTTQNTALHYRNSVGPQPQSAKTPARPRSIISKGLNLTENPPQQPRADIENSIMVLTQKIKDLELENDGLNQTVEVLDDERLLYYDKLVDIEQLINQQLDMLYTSKGDVDAADMANNPMMALIRQIQVILFSTPEGFQPQTRPEDEPF